MEDFEKLCKVIIDTNGNPSVQQVFDCGYSMEHFIRMSQPNVNRAKLVEHARQNLLDRGIHYKEGLMKKKNKYEELFDAWMEVTEFKLLKYGNKFGVEDLQGADLGDIQSDRFTTAMEIIDRMDVYVQDYLICDIDDALDEKNIEITWDGDYASYLEHVKELIPDYPFDIAMLDLIVNHIEEVDLNNCDYTNA